MNSPLLLVAGLLYALLFWLVASRKPAVALFMVLATTPFTNDISGGGPAKFSLAEIHLFLSLPLLLLRPGKIVVGATFLPALGYMGVALFSGFLHWHPSTVTSFIQIGLYIVIAVVVFASLPRRVEDYLPAIFGLVAVSLLFALAVLVERTGFVFGRHKNLVGGILAASFLITFEFWLAERRGFRRWVYFAAWSLLAAGCLLTLSRGSWICAIIGLVVLLSLRRQYLVLLKLVLVLIPVACLIWSVLPEKQRAYTLGFESERWNIRMRYESKEIALQNFRESPVFGMGLGLRKEYDATNFVLLALGETGVVGLLALIILHIVVAVVIWRAHRALPRNCLAASMVAIGGALVFGRLAHGMVDHYWGRGTITIAWATFGMAVHVDHEVRRRRRLAQRPAGPALAAVEVPAPVLAGSGKGVSVS